MNKSQLVNAIAEMTTVSSLTSAVFHMTSLTSTTSRVHGVLTVLHVSTRITVGDSSGHLVVHGVSLKSSSCRTQAGLTI